MNLLRKIRSEKSVVGPVIACGLNILLIFVVYSLLRVEYLLENWNYFREAVSDGSIWRLFCAGPVFDAPGIFYLNAIYILLMLLPLHWKERRGYYKACKWVFIIINSLGVIANLADSIYFSYTLRRTTWDLFAEFGGDDNMGKIVGVELIRHWYLVILAIGLVWGIWRLYSTPEPGANPRPLWRYYLLSALGLGAGAVTTIGAIRGGFLNHWWMYLTGGIAIYIGRRVLPLYSRGKRLPSLHSKGEGGDEVGVSLGRRLLGSFLWVGGIVLIAMAPMGGWRHRDIRPVALSNANRYISRPNEAALILNTPFTLIRTIGAPAYIDPRYMKNDEMEALYSPVHHPGDEAGARGEVNLAGDTLLRRKNVVVIILESFGREYIGAMNKDILGEDYKGYAPFLDSLSRVSATWEVSLDNGRKSIEAMPSVLAGIPSFMKSFVLTPAAMSEIKGLPAILGAQGYHTAFFHGARKGSMGFDGFARSVGFKEYYGRESFVEDGRAGGEEEFDGYWGIWDEPFLQYFALKLSDFPQPFMASLFTLSSHHPFNVPEKYKGKFPEGEAPIHKTIGYTDYALREFFATARRQPWYENTIFVITNDHTNERTHDEYRSAISTFYGPILIFDPSEGLPRGEQKGIAQQTDIMPTVLGLLGNRKEYLAFGKDLFATPAGESWAVNHIGYYQYVKYGYVLQFDGKKAVGLYKIGDHKMERNILGTAPDIEGRMEQELKALIQQYMQRMSAGRLTADSQ